MSENEKSIINGMPFGDAITKTMKELEKQLNELKTFNLMVLGKTGVGKSTLINKIFWEDLAETGIGTPVTDDIKKYEKPGFRLRVYDSPGLELGGKHSFESLKEQAVKVIKDGLTSGDIGDAIHAILYCVSTPSKRFEETEAAFIRSFLDETKSFSVPVIIVLTQSYSKGDAKALKSAIQKESLNVADIVPILAEEESFDETKIDAFGLDTLAKTIHSVIPKAIQNSFGSAQRVDMEMKLKNAFNIVKTASLAAFGIGAQPIPFADAVLLVPEQLAMLVGISLAFGYRITRARIMAILSATIGPGGATILGKTTVSALVKLIPGAGNLISGSIAASITFALGRAYIYALQMVCNGQISENKLEEKLMELFEKGLKTAENANTLEMSDIEKINIEEEN